MDIKLSKDAEASLMESIKRYVLENFETSIGDLQSSLFPYHGARRRGIAGIPARPGKLPGRPCGQPCPT
jgi:hypothetical protein